MAAPPEKTSTSLSRGSTTHPVIDPVTDYDSPWKAALEQYFPAFLELLVPWLHKLIDWSVAPIFLDKELQAVDHHSIHGRRYADKLVQVQTKTGQPLRLLIHVEIQGGKITVSGLQHFATRMYQYNHRIHDHYVHKKDTALVSLGVLTNSRSTDTELVYTRTDLNVCSTQFRFPVVHLANWLEHWDELEAQAATNPFAVIVMAQLQAQNTRKNDKQRLVSKTQIMRLLYRYNYSTNDARNIFRLVDWMITTPAALEREFELAMITLEQEYKVTYVTSLERLWDRRYKQRYEQHYEQYYKQYYEEKEQHRRQESLRDGEAALLQRQLTQKFGTLPDEAQQRLQTATQAQLETWSLNILDANDLDSVFTD